MWQATKPMHKNLWHLYIYICKLAIREKFEGSKYNIAGK